MTRPWETDLTKLSKMELVKLEKDGLDILNEIAAFGQAGFSSIKPEDIDLLKWAGVYVQKPKTDGYFMMRVKLPSGKLSSNQATVLAGIARDYGRGEVQLTTRQAIQFHWIRIENLPDIFHRLDRVGLSSIEACGDCPRTIMGNPLAGIDRDELLDTTPLVHEVATFFQGNREFSNLPRKFKISISASPVNPGHAEINDLAFIPAVKEIDGKIVNGFHVMVGGGLSAKPHMAKKLDLFVCPEDVLKVSIAVATIFRDYGYRQQRFHCRLKFLVADWGAAKFREELVKLTGPLPSAGVDVTVGWNGGFYYGVNSQKQAGLVYVGLSVPTGLMNADELDGLARLAAAYGDGSLRTANSQNIIIANILEGKADRLLQEPLLQKFKAEPKPFIGYAVACTGNRYCTLSVAETKERLKAITAYLDERVSLDTPVRIHIAGCPNSCGQQQIADIGLQGTLVKQDNKAVEGFEIAIGGNLGPGAAFATKLKGRIPADDVAKVIAHLVKVYKANREEGETFCQLVERVGVLVFQAVLDEYLATAEDKETEKVQKVAK